MDQSLYKDTTVSRGLKYHYFYSSPSDSTKPTLLFLHGFPNTSFDWRHQIPTFKNEGYGIIAPDLIGFGRTDKPTATEAYAPALYTRDIADVLDAEKIDTVVVVAHDWGSSAASQFVTYYPERVIAIAFFAVGYYLPRQHQDFQEACAMSKQAFGYELFGYWDLFAAPDAEELITKHWESFYSIAFSKDPSVWKDHFAPIGALRKALLEDKVVEVADFIDEEDRRHRDEMFGDKVNLAGGLQWYKSHMLGYDVLSTLPNDASVIAQKPAFLGTAEKDYVCLASLQVGSTQQIFTNCEVHKYEAGHWLLAEAKDKVNEDLLEWVKKVAK